MISLSSILILGLTTFLIGALFVHLSHSLHNSMLRRVVHAPMRFFYSNPLGRIINRFSKDTAMADSVVVLQTMQVLQVSSSHSDVLLLPHVPRDLFRPLPLPLLPPPLRAAALRSAPQIRSRRIGRVHPPGRPQSLSHQLPLLLLSRIPHYHQSLQSAGFAQCQVPGSG